MDPHAIQKIQSYFNKRAQKEKCRGFAATLQLKENTHQFTGGHLSEEGLQPVNHDSLFEIGSLSKTVTAALIHELVLKKEIDTSENVYHYLSQKHEINPIFRHVVIRGLLVHRAGLPRFPHVWLEKMKGLNDPYSILNKKDLTQFFAVPAELNQPGKFRYSNLGYVLLAEIICTVCDKDFNECARELLFSPLGMKRTGTLANFIGDTNISKGYAPDNKEHPYWTGVLLNGAGSFLSTNTDMLLFLDYAKKMEQPEQWGWQIKNGFLSKIMGYRGFVWHNGMTGGFASYMAFHPERSTAMFVLVNKAAILDHWFYYFSSYR